MHQTVRRRTTTASDGLYCVGEDAARSRRGRDRRLPAILLSVVVDGAVRRRAVVRLCPGHPASGGRRPGAAGDGVPLIRADERPTKVKPDQPGGMQIPDQKVSLYNEKPGGAPVREAAAAAGTADAASAPAPQEPASAAADAAATAGARRRTPPAASPAPAPPPRQAAAKAAAAARGETAGRSPSRRRRAAGGRAAAASAGGTRIQLGLGAQPGSGARGMGTG